MGGADQTPDPHLRAAVEDPVESPADFESTWTLTFLRARAVDGVEQVEDRRYRRVLTIGNRPTLVTVRFGLATNHWAIEPSRPGLELVVGRLFGTGADLVPFLAMASNDPILGPLVAKRPGLRVPTTPTPFEAAVRAIVGQLISVAAARTILSRLARQFGEPVGDRLLFPGPEALAAAGQSALQGVGLTAAKARALGALSLADRRGELDWTSLHTNGERADEVLTALPGIGPWTSGYVRIRGLADPDAFLPTDLGIVRALEARGVDRHRIETTAERWRPWRSYAAIHLWASFSD